MTESRPRLALLHDSAWYIPQVLLVMPAAGQHQETAVKLSDLPLPKPLTTRPTINCGKDQERNCSMAPVVLRTAPILSVFFRPSLSPKAAASRQPTRLPS